LCTIKIYKCWNSFLLGRYKWGFTYGNYYFFAQFVGSAHAMNVFRHALSSIYISPVSATAACRREALKLYTARNILTAWIQQLVHKYTSRVRDCTPSFNMCFVLMTQESYILTSTCCACMAITATTNDIRTHRPHGVTQGHNTTSRYRMEGIYVTLNFDQHRSPLKIWEALIDAPN